MDSLPISVIVPTYNRSHVLRRAIESVSNQTRGAAEIVVADDASTDNTVDIARALGCKVVENSTNLGPAATRNVAISAASQPWVAFLDSDDEWLPHHLETLWPHTKQFNLVASTTIMIDENLQPFLLRGNVSDADRILSKRVDVLLPVNCIPTSSVIVNRQLLQSVGAFNDFRRAEDLDLWLRIVAREPCLQSNEVTMRYYLSSDQTIVDTELMDAHVISVAQANGATGSVMKKVMALQRWDRSRALQRNGKHKEANKELVFFIRNPQLIPYFMKVLQSRRACKRATEVYKSHGTNSQHLQQGSIENSPVS